eukprot:GHVS01046625.1.p1 GENE.GHVS01046625.1~~GHVS01046625.1.p1  ORF type:complete len:127 (-),score=12.97 GHVS01046625.1:174-554(-)
MPPYNGWDRQTDKGLSVGDGPQPVQLSRLVATSSDEEEEEHFLTPSMRTLQDFEVREDDIPARKREAPMFVHHTGRLGGHQGINRTVARLRTTVRWLDQILSSIGGTSRLPVVYRGGGPFFEIPGH